VVVRLRTCRARGCRCGRTLTITCPGTLRRPSGARCAAVASALLRMLWLVPWRHLVSVSLGRPEAGCYSTAHAILRSHPLNSAYGRYNVTSFSVIALSAGLCDSDSEGNLVIRPRPCHRHVISSWQTTPGPPAQFRSCEADGDDFTPYLNPDSPLLMIFHPLFSISHGVGQHGPPSQ
jgi:hypothetical protein